MQEMLRGAAPAVNTNSAPRASVPIEQFPPSRDPLWDAKRIQGLREPRSRDPLCVQGLFYVVNAADGTVTARIPLPATVVQDGIAIASGRAYAALADGSVTCLGEASR